MNDLRASPTHHGVPTSPPSSPLRFGLLGASRLGVHYIIDPAKEIPVATVTAAAARDRVRAERFAAEYQIPVACDSYEALLARDDVDAVYVPLPVSAHYEWCERALLAGKHVLCEKPLTMNAAQAEQLVGLADTRNRLLVEGFHYRHHPLILRALEVIASGELGAVEFVEAVVESTPNASASLWDPALGGGATRHNGCYAIHALRTITGAEPEVLGANVAWRDGVDAAITAHLSFPGNVSGTFHASMIRAEGFDVSLHVRGAMGNIRIDNFFGVGPLHIQTTEGDRRCELIHPNKPTSLYQLPAFVDSAQNGMPNATAGADIVANALAIDSTLAAAQR